MDITGFRKMTSKEKDLTYGGWAWLIAAIPLILQSVVTTVGSIKAMFSDKGSIKGKDFDAHWEGPAATKSKASSGDKKVVYYPY